MSTSRILLLDLDHTLYPSTSPTLEAVDARITTFIETTLSVPTGQADQMRRNLCGEYGTTLRGLELLHGVSREVYTTFIQDLGDHLMPTNDPRMRAWLSTAARHMPTYLFTNARRDWADRCLLHLGISDLVETRSDAEVEALASEGVRGIFDIDFMEWVGKPHASAFEKVENFLVAKHASQGYSDFEYIFADDRLDNLDGARARGWQTIWVRPHTAAPGGAMNGGAPGMENAAVTAIAKAGGHRVVDSLLDLDPEKLE